MRRPLNHRCATKVFSIYDHSAYPGRPAFRPRPLRDKLRIFSLRKAPMKRRQKKGQAFPMDVFASATRKKQAQRAIAALQKNNMEAFFLASKEEVPARVAALLHRGDTVSVGGSVTLKETGVLDLLTDGDYTYLDRYKPGLTDDEKRAVFLSAFAADSYLCSANAITENGELYNVDGASNRTAALLYGPRQVIVVAGWNKLVADLDAAVERVRNFAAPSNAMRLGSKTPCAKTGFCMDCESPDRICCNTVICGPQRIKGRIKVLLVGEELGY